MWVSTLLHRRKLCKKSRRFGLSPESLAHYLVHYLPLSVLRFPLFHTLFPPFAFSLPLSLSPSFLLAVSSVVRHVWSLCFLQGFLSSPHFSLPPSSPVLDLDVSDRAAALDFSESLRLCQQWTLLCNTRLNCILARSVKSFPNLALLNAPLGGVKNAVS